MTKSIVSIAGFLATAVVLSWFVPIAPQQGTTWVAAHIAWSVQIPMALLYLINAVLLFTFFKGGGTLWHMWRYLCISLLFLGISHLEIPIMQSLGWNLRLFSGWIDYGIPASFLIASLLFFTGTRHLSNVTKNKSVFSSNFNIAFTLVTVWIAGLLVFQLFPRQSSFIPFFLHYTESVFFLMGFIVLLSAYKSLGGKLAQSMHWFIGGIGLFTLINLTTPYLQLTGFQNSAFVTSGFYSGFFAIAGALLVYSTLLLKNILKE